MMIQDVGWYDTIVYSRSSIGIVYIGMPLVVAALGGSRSVISWCLHPAADSMYDRDHHKYCSSLDARCWYLDFTNLYTQYTITVNNRFISTINYSFDIT